MTHAYDEIYLSQARNSLGRMLDYVVYDLNYDLSEYWDIFLNSEVCLRFEVGDSSVVAGKSGIEMAYDVLEMYKNPVPPRFVMNRSAEYWTGWALAYYQWRSGLSFKNINEKVSIQDIFCMFHPYHEMDILQFCDKMDELVCT